MYEPNPQQLAHFFAEAEAAKKLQPPEHKEREIDPSSQLVFVELLIVGSQIWYAGCVEYVKFCERWRRV